MEKIRRHLGPGPRPKSPQMFVTQFPRMGGGEDPERQKPEARTKVSPSRPNCGPGQEEKRKDELKVKQEDRKKPSRGGLKGVKKTVPERNVASKKFETSQPGEDWCICLWRDSGDPRRTRGGRSTVIKPEKERGENHGDTTTRKGKTNFLKKGQRYGTENAPSQAPSSQENTQGGRKKTVNGKHRRGNTRKGSKRTHRQQGKPLPTGHPEQGTPKEVTVSMGGIREKLGRKNKGQGANSANAKGRLGEPEQGSAGTSPKGVQK